MCNQEYVLISENEGETLYFGQMNEMGKPDAAWSEKVVDKFCRDAFDEWITDSFKNFKYGGEGTKYKECKNDPKVVKTYAQVNYVENFGSLLTAENDQGR